MKYISTNPEKCSKWTSKTFFIFIIIAGIIIGSIIHKPFFECICPHFFSVKGNSVVHDITNTFLISLFYVFSAFIVGSSALGQPLAFLLLFYGGYTFGFCTFLMYNLYGKAAVIPIIMTFVPKAAVISVIMILALRTAFKSSATLFAVYCDGDVRDSRELNLKLYCIRFIVLILVSFIFSVAVGTFDYLYLRMCKL